MLKNILDIDYKDAEGKDKIQKELHGIKRFKKFEYDIPLEEIENLLIYICRKYIVSVACINPNYAIEGVHMYVLIIRIKHELHFVHGMTLYEITAKAALFLYDKAKNVLLEVR